MKRIIALLLALCMCYAMPVFADSSNPSLYEEEIEAYKFLNALEIVESVSENKILFFEQSANRGDFVRYAMLLGGYDVSNMTYTYSVYNDVSTTDKNFKYINYAYELGFVSGNGDFLFNPNNTISYNEAVKIITCVFDAEKMATALGGYPAGYAVAASKLGIKLDNVSDSDKLTNGEVIRLLHSALYAHTAFDNGEDVVVDHSDSGIAMEKYHDVRIVSGVVKSAGGIALTLDKYTETDEDEFLVENRIFKCSEDPKKLLGMNVDVYYQKRGNYDYAVYTDISDNEVTVIDSEAFCGIKNLKIEYTQTDVSFETKEKQKTITLSGDCDVIYNGKPYPFYDDKLLDLTTCNGSITCISNSGGRFADVVIVEAYSNYVVASVDQMNMYIYTKLPHDMLDFSGYSEVDVFDSHGNERSFDSIFASDVISVMKSADGKYAKIIASSTRENRKVMEKLSDDVVIFDNNKSAVLDFIVREKAENELLLGRLVDVCYDYKGRICDFIYNDYEDGIDYGYLIKVAGKTSGFSSTVKVKLLRLTNVMEEYFVAEELKLDGDKVTNKDFYDKFVLTDSSNGVKYTDMQMIKFAVDPNTGEINYIDSKYVGEKEGDSSLTSITHAKAYFIMDIGSLEGLNAFEKGYFLTVPMPDSSLPPSAANSIPDSLFTSADSIINAGDVSGTFEVVDADEAGWSSLMIHRPTWKPTGDCAESLEGIAKGDDVVAMVDSISFVIDDFENEVAKLVFYDTTGTKKTLLVRDKNLVKKAVTAEDGTVSYKTMEQGDLFCYETDKDGYISSIKLCLNVYNLTNEKFFRTTLDAMSGRACGPAYGVSDKGLSLLCTVKEGEVPDFSSGASYEEIFDVDNRYTRILGNNFSKVVVYDMENETISKGTLDDIVTCETDPACPSIVYARVSLARITYIFVINNYR